jgi:3',5'-cyclic AMP phosphodiesterase CpdA
MRTIVHLSDLHFGRLDERIIGPLVTRIAEIGPDLIAISGDLTQRARRRQFEHARAFLNQLRFPTLVVPGNHDVPLFNVMARLLDPFGAYRRYISPNLEPAHIDAEMAVVGLNSARAIVSGGRGRLNLTQIDEAAARLETLAAPAV